MQLRKFSRFGRTAVMDKALELIEDGTAKISNFSEGLNDLPEDPSISEVASRFLFMMDQRAENAIVGAVMVQVGREYLNAASREDVSDERFQSFMTQQMARVFSRSAARPSQSSNFIAAFRENVTRRVHASIFDLGVHETMIYEYTEESS